MGNIWEHPSTIAAEALTHLEDALVMSPLCAKDKTSEFTSKSNGWKVGDTVSFRTHGEYEVNDFAGSIVVQDIQNSSRAMTIEHHYDISVEVTAREASLDLDSFSDQVIQPAVYKLAEKVDMYLGTKVLGGAGLYVSSDLLANAADIAQARKAAILQQLSKGRFSLIDLDLEAKLLGQTWFNQSQTRGGAGEQALKEAEMGRTMGMDWFTSLAFPTNSVAHVTGTGVATTNNTVATANKIGLRILTVDAGSAGNIKAGDRLAVAGLKRPLIAAQDYADLTAVTAIALVDPITEIVQDNASVTIVGTGNDLIFQGAIFDDRSLAVAFPMLDLPEDKIAATASNEGVSIRIVKGYDMNSKKTTLSLDLLVGSFMLDPRRVTLLAEGTPSS